MCVCVPLVAERDSPSSVPQKDLLPPASPSSQSAPPRPEVWSWQSPSHLAAEIIASTIQSRSIYLTIVFINMIASLHFHIVMKFSCKSLKSRKALEWRA